MLRAAEINRVNRLHGISAKLAHMQNRIVKLSIYQQLGLMINKKIERSKKSMSIFFRKNKVQSSDIIFHAVF